MFTSCLFLIEVYTLFYKNRGIRRDLPSFSMNKRTDTSVLMQIRDLVYLIFFNIPQEEIENFH
jgi:hypothetical protein